MKTSVKKSLIAAAAFSLASLASAASVTITTGNSVLLDGMLVSGLSGSGTLAFSPTLIGALNAGKVAVSAVPPATAQVVYKTNPKTGVVTIATAAAAAPVTTLTADYNASTLSVTQVTTAGGALQNAPIANIATSGGSLEITNLRVDLSAKKVYADLNGANGVGAQTNVYLWDIANISGPTTIDISAGMPRTVTNTLSGLSINTPAFNLFAQAMGLTSNGITSLKTVTDFGTITSTITIGAVPEPATSAMMGVGLVAVGMVVRRRRGARA